MAFKTQTSIVGFDVVVTVHIPSFAVTDIVRAAYYVDEDGNIKFNKISAIKTLRDRFASENKATLGLRDAKEIIETMYSHMYPD